MHREDHVKYVFLTAFRNEALVLDAFLRELVETARRAGIIERAVLYLVDDLSTDDSRAVIEAFRAREPACEIKVLSVPTNLGNQGAMFHGIHRIACDHDDVLITLDSDGEDDVGAVGSIIELGRQHPDKVVFIERGRRSDSASFKVFFFLYRLLFRILTDRKVVANNYMLIPGRYVETIRRSPLAATHLANGILRLNLPALVVSRDRRPRYGGRTTQNLFMLITHGLVGIIMFYEVVVPKILTLVLALALLQTAAMFLPVIPPAGRLVILMAGTAMIAAAIGFLVCATTALGMKLVAYRTATNGAPPE